MLTYRIYTEDVNREKIERICLEELLFGQGFTIIKGTGHWDGLRENCAVIEVIGRAHDRDHVLKAASRIKKKNKQEAIMVTATQAENVWMIGEKILPLREI